MKIKLENGTSAHVISQARLNRFLADCSREGMTAPEIALLTCMISVRMARLAEMSWEDFHLMISRVIHEDKGAL